MSTRKRKSHSRPFTHQVVAQWHGARSELVERSSGHIHSIQWQKVISSLCLLFLSVQSTSPFWRDERGNLPYPNIVNSYLKYGCYDSKRVFAEYVVVISSRCSKWNQQLKKKNSYWLTEWHWGGECVVVLLFFVLALEQVDIRSIVASLKVDRHNVNTWHEPWQHPSLFLLWGSTQTSLSPPVTYHVGNFRIRHETLDKCRRGSVE